MMKIRTVFLEMSNVGTSMDKSIHLATLCETTCFFARHLDRERTYSSFDQTWSSMCVSAHAQWILHLLSPRQKSVDIKVYLYPIELVANVVDNLNKTITANKMGFIVAIPHLSSR